MPGMPYSWAKGDIFAALDARYSSPSVKDRHALLSALRAPGSGTLGGTLDTLRFPPYNQNAFRAALKAHLNQHWFGFPVDQNTGEATGSQPAYNAVTHPYTGWWAGWYGNAAEIFRRGLSRAVEASLGIQPEAPLGAQPPASWPRMWPVEFFWTCGAPRFEVYVNWSPQRVGTSGRVTVTVLTPAVRAGFGAWSPYLVNKIDATIPGIVEPTDPQFANAFTAAKARGMLIVGENTVVTKGAKGGVLNNPGVREGLMQWDAQGVNASGVTWSGKTNAATKS